MEWSVMQQWITDTALSSFEDWRCGQVHAGNKNLSKGCGGGWKETENCLVELHETRTFLSPRTQWHSYSNDVIAMSIDCLNIITSELLSTFETVK